MGSKVGVYIRVSTLDQEKGIDSQEKAIREYLDGHEIKKPKFYKDRLSGKTTNRPAFKQLQKDIFNGKIKTVICWKLDRLSRSLRDGINILHDWMESEVRVISISQRLDFSNSMGKLLAAIFYGLAEMERENLRENTKRGMKAAKARGVKLGKRPKLFTKDLVPMLQNGKSVTEIARAIGKSRQAIYDAFRRENVDIRIYQNQKG